MKRAAIHELNGKIFAQGYSRTTVGMGKLNGAVYSANIDDLTGIGQAILSALQECKEGIPHPDYRKKEKEDSPMLIATGVKTWNTLMKISKSVQIKLKNDNLELTPLKFMGLSGPNKGYKFLDDKMVITDLNPEHIGQAVLKALEACE